MLCIYHKNCMDGMVAASVVAGVHPDIRLLALDYTYPEIVPEYAPGEVIYVVDFSFSGAVLVDHFKDAGAVIVMDHHLGAIDKLADYFRSTPIPQNVELIMDVNKSGALLAWEYFHPGLTPSKMVEHTSDRDLWQFKNLDTKAYMEALSAEPMTLEAYREFDQIPYAVSLAAGQALLKKKSTMVQWHIDNGTAMVEFEGHVVPCINAPRYVTSDIADTLKGKYPFILIYHDVGYVRNFSMRSDNPEANLHLIAQRYNGNGHPKAAGFRADTRESIFHILD
jgi:uncharacterized protein